MDKEQLKQRTKDFALREQRTKDFALRVIRCVESLPSDPVARHVGGQLLRCGTSVASNYRVACRARSKADFIAKMGIVEEEADESLVWMELVIESGKVEESRLSELMQEASEIIAIVVASINTARGGPRKQ